MKHIFTKDALAGIDIFQHLTEEQIDVLCTQIKKVHYKKNTEIYTLGVTPEFVYIIEKGSVKLGITALNGKSLTKEIVYDNDIFGENIFTNNPQTQEVAEAMTDSILLAIPVHIFRQLAVKNVIFANQVMSLILYKLQDIETRLQNFVFCKAKERIVDYLFRSGQRRGIKIGFKECLITHGITHKEIAYLTDTSRQTVARIMNELKRANFIHYESRKSSKILIRDMVLLQNYRED